MAYEPLRTVSPSGAIESGGIAVKPGQVILIMGVSGVGKTTVGVQLAETLGMPFLEGDQYHSAESVQKMAAGTPLGDADRWPWLDRLSSAIVENKEEKGVVATCSALKRSYRDHLRRAIGEPLLLVCLLADRKELRDRMQSREAHFMSPTLLDSQLQTLEVPEADESAIILTPCAGDQSLATLRQRLYGALASRL